MVTIMTKLNVTIKEIAKEAKVSTATVSMILNAKDKRISQATREKVQEIAKKLNYIPNTLARSLVTRQTKTIGLIMPDITNPFFPEIARGAEDKASQSGYSIIYCNSDDNIEREDKYIDTLTEKMVDGIILAHSADREEGLRGLNRCRVPIVLIDRDYDIPNVIGKVLVDNTEASYKGVSYLLDRGYKKIVYIAGPLNTKTAKDRLAGYKIALAEKQIDFSERYLKIGEYKSKWGETAAKELIEDDLKFDAIFCGNDLIAMGVMKVLKSSKIKIPDDVAVMGFDDIYMASIIEPALTTIKQPNYEMGFRAVELLLNAIESKDYQASVRNKVNPLVLVTELIIRKSS